MRNIVLIGMAACGKSTVGVLLAKAAGMGFVDTDLLIQQKHGVLLAELLETEGIAAFLGKESDVLYGLMNLQNTCIATGGSAVYAGEAMHRLRQSAVTVFLDVSYETIACRIADIKSRGVVIEPGKTLYELYIERRPLYERYADVTIAADGLTAEQAVEEILKSARLQ